MAEPFPLAPSLWAATAPAAQFTPPLEGSVTADVVVIGEGERRAGLTEDYLSVALADEAMPRRSRFLGRLDAGADGKLTAGVR